jgi:hypothetical protein
VCRSLCDALNPTVACRSALFQKCTKRRRGADAARGWQAGEVNTRCVSGLEVRSCLRRLVRAHVASLAGVVDVCPAAASRCPSRAAAERGLRKRRREDMHRREDKRIISAVVGS